jgi:hypothetical protein
MRKIIYASILLLVIGSGCKVAEKEFRKGDYDEAIDICVKKLIDNPDKAEYIVILEQAFVRANGAELDAIKALNTEGRPDRWEEIYGIYSSIYNRQEKIKPLLPLYLGTEERDAEFQLVNAVDGLNTAKKNAAAYWYANATLKLSTGDIYKSREAYYELKKITNYYNEYKDVYDLIEKAKKAGTNDVVFQVNNVSNASMNHAVNEALFDISALNETGQWYIIHNDYAANQIEYTIRLNIRKVEAYQEQVTTNRYQESKEIIDGYEFVYDSEGNIVKDSLGNPVKVPDYKTVTAYVVETWQEKIATVSGEVVYIDKSGRVIKSIPVRSDAVFQNYYATATGYYEALSAVSKAKIGGKPMPFPNDDIMLIDACKQLECNVRDVLDDYNDEYLNL